MQNKEMNYFYSYLVSKNNTFLKSAKLMEFFFKFNDIKRKKNESTL